MLSFTVFYNTEKKIFKSVPASTLLQQVLLESAETFRINPQNCTLKYRKAPLDLSQPLRFSNLPNNAQLDLVVSVSNSKQMCRVAISCPEYNSSFVESVPDTTNLWDLLELAGKDIKFPCELSPELIYMRASFQSRESMEQTTLRSLGLAGQAARFQLRFRPGLQQATSGALSEEEPEQEMALPEKNEVEPSSRPKQVDTKEVEAELRREVPGASVLVIGPAASPPPSMNPPPTTTTTTTTAVAIVAAVPMEVIGEEEERTVFEALENDPRQQLEFLRKPVPTPRAVVEQLLADNFDVVTRPTVVTLMKYLQNILSAPNNEKFRTIRSDNKVFQEKIRPAKGAEAFLQSIGFRELRESSSFVLAASEGDMSKIEAGVAALEFAMNELDIPAEERPVARPPVVSGPPIDFDPFKPLVFRQAIQPVREEASATNSQLDQLKRKRAELEGRPEKVQRETRVILPNEREAGSPLVSSEGKTVREEEGGDSGEMGSSARKSLIQKILKKPDDEAPLTTAAVRELQKLQSEKVYQKTIVRVRFPDKLQLVGSFHPRHTLGDVYEWVLGCLAAEQTEAVPETVEERVVRAMNLFELFVSPPRTVLLPATLGGRGGGGKKDAASQTVKEWNNADLLSLGLVPAAVLSLAWVGDNNNNKSSSEPGSYLQEDLRNQSNLASSASSSSSFNPFSAGVALVAKKESGGRAEEAFLSADSKTSSGSGKKAEADGEKAKSRPKWFKL